MFVLDTDVSSNLPKQTQRPAVLRRLQATAASDLSTTVISVAEIQCGIERQMSQDAVCAADT